jgi:hypothetical protein
MFELRKDEKIIRGEESFRSRKKAGERTVSFYVVGDWNARPQDRPVLKACKVRSSHVRLTSLGLMDTDSYKTAKLFR